MFIQSKWAEWTENLRSIIPLNIKKGVIATHICDDIYWKNIKVNRSETHHTNSILVQKHLIENVSNEMQIIISKIRNSENHTGHTSVLYKNCLTSICNVDLQDL